jgi:acetate kinase
MSPVIRNLAVQGLQEMGIVIDQKKNALAMCRNAEFDITGLGSKVKIFIIPTDEELVMTEDTVALINGTYDVHTNYHYYFENHDYVNRARAEGLQRDLEKKPWLKDIVARIP